MIEANHQLINLVPTRRKREEVRNREEKGEREDERQREREGERERERARDREVSIIVASSIRICTFAGVPSSTPDIFAGLEPLIENPYVFSSIISDTVLGFDQTFSAQKYERGPYNKIITNSIL